MNQVRSLLMTASCLSFCSHLPADEAPQIQTTMTERGKLVFREDFHQPPDKQWLIKEPIWETVDGAIKATHRAPFPANHGPIMQHPIALDNAIVQVSFKLEGTARATLHFNKKNGHLCRAHVRADEVLPI